VTRLWLEQIKDDEPKEFTRVDEIQSTSAAMATCSVGIGT